jgi:uncharacterized protein YdeI (YjbR/CyaY-like superfamily)
MAIPEGQIKFYAKDRNEWRRWLEKNHASEKKVWLLMYHKNSGMPGVYYAEAVEEALCFGWIDSRPNKNDDKSFYLSFSPRKSGSVWSQLNKDRVKKLIKDGKMHPAGAKMIALARKNGMWNALKKIDQMEIPDDLSKAFRKNKTALRNFESFPPSSKKIILGWIESAKRIETREKRIQETIALAEKNIRANHYVKKK